MTLDDYFHLIVKQTQKETTMFERSKAYFQSLKDSWSSLYKWDVKITEEEPVRLIEDDDYWAFEMYTYEWTDELNMKRPAKHSLLIEPHEGTWPEVLDKILDEMGKHYGYNIKEQVYYSVNFPMNIDNPDTKEPMPGHSRLLNDEVLQQLLLAFPEVYEPCTSWDKPTNVFA